MLWKLVGLMNFMLTVSHPINIKGGKTPMYVFLGKKKEPLMLASILTLTDQFLSNLVR